jgi:predicted kinase
MITLTIGISNSGKTTWAEQQDAMNINRDDIRLATYCNGESLSHYKFTKTKEKDITEVQFLLAKDGINQGQHVIISDTNLNPKTRQRWVEFAALHNVKLEVKEFPCEPHIAKARNIKREYSIPPSVIDRQYNAWRKYKGLPTYRGTPGKPRAIIFDMDGTLADMTGIRRPFEWLKVGMDKPRETVIQMARMYHNAGYKIIVMSGRDGSCFLSTANWLHKHSVPFTEMFMRVEGDSRPDAEIKEELFWFWVADNYDVKLSVDDRDQMVSRWRAMGIECFQVQPGDF